MLKQAKSAADRVGSERLRESRKGKGRVDEGRSTAQLPLLSAASAIAATIAADVINGEPLFPFEKVRVLLAMLSLLTAGVVTTRQPSYPLSPLIADG